MPDTTARPTEAATAMVWRTRDTTRHLLEAFIGGFGISLVTGLLLWLDVGGTALAQVMLITHLVAGSLGLLFFAVYVVFHLKDGREPWINLLWPFRLIPDIPWDPYAAKRLHGHALLWANAVVLLTGVVIALPGITHLLGRPDLILAYGANYWLTTVHDGATLAAVGLLFFHFPARDRA